MLTAADVKAVMVTSVEDSLVDGFISDAAEFLATFPEPITSGLVHKYFTCHLVALRDPRVTQRSTDGASAAFELATAAGKSGLKSTTYGQQAIAMDMTGQLAKYAQGRTKTTLRAM